MLGISVGGLTAATITNGNGETPMALRAGGKMIATESKEKSQSCHFIPKAANSVVSTCPTSLGSPHTPGEVFAGKLSVLREQIRAGSRSSRSCHHLPCFASTDG